MKRNLKMFSCLMAVIMLIISLPLYAFADLVDTPSANSYEEAGNAEPKEVIVLCEDEGLRDENIKHFKLSDGTTKAVMYPEAVHYKDKNGNWVDIDNALTLNGSEYSSNNKLQIKFANKSGSAGTVSIADGDYKIDFTPLNANKVSVSIENSQSNNSRKFEDMCTLNNLISKAIYADIYDGADIEYVLVGNNIKENIILKEKKDSYSFSFELKLNKLEAELTNGAIILSDINSGEKVYEIPMPYMFDANGAYSENVEYSLVKESKWKYTFTVTANAEWINDDSRAFPVTVDPSVDIAMGWITQGYLSSTGGKGFYSSTTDIGKISSSESKDVYMKFDTSYFSIPVGATVTSAELSLYKLSGDNIDVGVYKVTQDWTPDNINTVNPTRESFMMDYVCMDANTYYSWDITKAYKTWESGSNYGVCLKSLSSQGYVTVTTKSIMYMPLPELTVTYVSTLGLEDYYSYYTATAGAAGTAYINSFSGNMTFLHNVFTTADEVMPYSVNLIFDSSSQSWRLSTEETLTKSVLGYSSSTAYTWTDGDGTVHWFMAPRKTGTIPPVYYQYDENGAITETNNPTEFYDEDGLGLKVSAIDGKYEMSDDAGNKKIFNKTTGYLETIRDVYGNERTFVRTDGKLTSVKIKPVFQEASITQINFFYGSDGKLTGVTNVQTGVSATISYTGNLISSITYNYSESSSYTVSYLYTSNLLTVAKDNEAQKGLRFEFSNYKAVSIKEIGYENGTENYGEAVSISYSDRESVLRSAGSDNVLFNSDDILTIRKFDYRGRLCTAYTATTDGQILGISDLEYTSQDDENYTSKQNNAIKSVLYSSGSSVNLILNATFESGLGYWNRTNTSTNANSTPESTAYNSDKLLHNGKYVQLMGSGINTVSKIYTSPMSLTSGTYTFSASVLPSNITSGSYAKLMVYNSSGNVVSTGINITADAGEAIWKREFITFDVTSSGQYTLSIELYAPSGEYVSVDNVMLEKSSGMGCFSEFINGGFESSSSGLSFSNGSISANAGICGNAARLNSTLSRKSSVSYTYNVGDGWDIENMMFSFWAYVPDALACTNKMDGSNVPGFYVKVSYVFDENSRGSVEIPIDIKGSGWQCYSGRFKVWTFPRVLKQVTFSINYDYNQGSAYIDMVSLNRSAKLQEYSYNSLGYVSTVTDSNGNTTNYEYKENNYEIDYITDEYLNKTKLTYDAETHNVTKKELDKRPNDNIFEYDENYSYNSFGKLSYVANMDIERASRIVTNYAYSYSNNGSLGKLSSVTDVRGNTTSYVYYSNGLLQGSCLNYDYGVIYNYNEYGELLSVAEARFDTSTQQMQAITSQSDSQVTYSYNSKHEIDNITLANKVYSFEYDKYGNTTSVKIGNQSLSSYEYQSNNGHLNKMTYGNGVEVTYLYDALDRVAEIRYNNISKAKYVYSPNGQLSSVEDVANNTRTVYYYDSDGNCISRRTEKNGTTVQSVFCQYDLHGRLSCKYVYYPDSTPYNNVIPITYSYDDDGNIVCVCSDNFHVSYDYDNLGRFLSYETDCTEGDFSIKDIYSYPLDEMTLKTSPLVSNVQTQIGSSSKNTSYTYDEKGNILSITFSDTNKSIYYKYDDMNRLIREDNQPLNKTFSYEYDPCGNLLWISVFDYTRVSDIESLTPNEYYSYGHSNSQWGDLLTSVTHGYPASGQSSSQGSLTYDAIGNPLNYFNGKNSYVFTWQNGRQLATVKRGSSTIATYAYNQDGIRTTKICGNSKHEYYLDGNKVVREVETRVDNGNLIKDSQYFYDVRGYISSATVLYYNSTGTSYTTYNFLFRTNMQGDVIEIYNTSGSLVMGITYDAWGNFTDTISSQDVVPTTEQAIALGLPFRYRGYYYDTETGFYYVSSRYYDPEIGRWINADTTDVLSLPYYHLGQYNLFSYCNNNPLNDRDDDGQLSWLAKIAIGVAAIAIGVGVTALTGGAALPALVAGVKAACVAGAISAGTSAATTAVRSAVSGDSFSTVVQKSAKAAVDGFADGFMAGGIAAGASQVASGGFKIAAKLGAKTGKSGGIKIGNTKILSPDAAWHKNNGGTLLKIGKTFRIDVGSNTLLHMHLPNVSSHIQIGTIGAGIYGGLK